MHGKDANATPILPAPTGAAIERPFLLGIGGCGMSGLAQLLAGRGLCPTGADRDDTALTRSLIAQGISVQRDTAETEIPADADGVILSAAIRPDHPLLLQAIERGLPTISYAEALGSLMASSTGVAVAGTHGKSTTVAMLGCCLTDAGLDPNVIVGATCPQLAQGALAESVDSPARGFRAGALAIPTGHLADQPGLLLAEACEFNRSFHSLRPHIGCVLNVEADHLDIYGTLDAVVEAFGGFAALLPSADEGGVLLIGHDGAHRREIASRTTARIETIGFSPEADWRIAFDVETRRVELTGPNASVSFTSPLPGEHMASNAAAAAALAIISGADSDAVGRSITAFRGLDRRLQLLGERPVAGGAVTVYDDYGHHPTEIDATLRAIRTHERITGNRRLICVFQPHQHSRTRFLLDEFAQSLARADAVIVPDIYFVRDSEAERARVSSSDLVSRLEALGVAARVLMPFDAIAEELAQSAAPGDVVVVIGAGPVWKVARAFLDSAPKQTAESDGKADTEAAA